MPTKLGFGASVVTLVEVAASSEVDSTGLFDVPEVWLVHATKSSVIANSANNVLGRLP